MIDKQEADRIMEGFRQYYQPIVSLDDAKIIYHEGLLRLPKDRPNPEVSPMELVLSLERAGKTTGLDSWSIYQAFRYIEQNKSNSHLAPIAINLSGHSINDERFSNSLLEFVSELKDPSRINFEITETAPLNNIIAVRSFVESIKGMGSKVAIDDYGKGFADESYLFHLPVDTLKIDGDYVKNYDDGGAEFIEHTVSLGRQYDVDILAERIETVQDMKRVKDLGVSMGQGYLFGKASEYAMNNFSVKENMAQKTKEDLEIESKKEVEKEVRSPAELKNPTTSRHEDNPMSPC